MGSSGIGRHQKSKYKGRVSLTWHLARNLGETTLTDPCSIVAVHGLGSKPDTAWLANRSKANWLADFLPQTHANFRVIALNHDSRWDAYSPVQSLRDYGQVVLDTIATLRRDEEVTFVLAFDNAGSAHPLHRRTNDP